MSRAAMYIYRKRVVLGRGKPYGPVKHGPWKRVCAYATLSEAQGHMDRDKVAVYDPGPYDRAVFYRGRRLK